MKQAASVTVDKTINIFILLQGAGNLRHNNALLSFYQL